MGGVHHHQGNNHRVPDDPYAKIKFTIPSFSGHYDAEGYLDWEMTIKQKFSAHLVPEHHRVCQATSEFKDFAIIWWNGLAAQDALSGFKNFILVKKWSQDPLFVVTRFLSILGKFFENSTGHVFHLFELIFSVVISFVLLSEGKISKK